MADPAEVLTLIEGADGVGIEVPEYEPDLPDMVNHPPHYTSSPAHCSSCGKTIECIDVVQWMNFCIGNAVKYLWRVGNKWDDLEDLKKSIWYINAEIARREKELNE